MRYVSILLLLLAGFLVNPAAAQDPNTAPRATIDRFSADAGMLFIRDDANSLPDANQPINFDEAPFITQGFGPNGEVVQYYNFDVQPTTPAPIFVLFREGEDAPVEGQLNLVEVIPGDEGYNDFWQVVRVTVPSDYEANTLTSVDAIRNAGYTMEVTDILVNCPIVPEGSTASLRYTDDESAELTQGWYNDEVVYYFNFSEAALSAAGSSVPISPIYVTFNINPDQAGGGPPSGFVTEAASAQTHNVIATLPGDESYSPLWLVNVYDNADFGTVMDLTSAQSANLLGAGVALVNCPVVSLDATGTAVEQLSDELPAAFDLEQNYPNPFNPETTIQYALTQSGSVSLQVFNVLGQKVADLVNDVQTAGTYRASWNGQDLTGRAVASGIYLYRLTLNGQQSQLRTMTLLK